MRFLTGFEGRGEGLGGGFLHSSVTLHSILAFRLKRNIGVLVFRSLP